jgi:hypothetical protein
MKLHTRRRLALVLVAKAVTCGAVIAQINLPTDLLRYGGEQTLVDQNALVDALKNERLERPRAFAITAGVALAAIMTYSKSALTQSGFSIRSAAGDTLNGQVLGRRTLQGGKVQEAVIWVERSLSSPDQFLVHIAARQNDNSLGADPSLLIPMTREQIETQLAQLAARVRATPGSIQ